jgi:hypothetical protein
MKVALEYDDKDLWPDKNDEVVVFKLSELWNDEKYIRPLEVMVANALLEEEHSVWYEPSKCSLFIGLWAVGGDLIHAQVPIYEDFFEDGVNCWMGDIPSTKEEIDEQQKAITGLDKIITSATNAKNYLENNLKKALDKQEVL